MTLILYNIISYCCGTPAGWACALIYIYIYRERERERERDVHLCWNLSLTTPQLRYNNIYIYIHTYIMCLNCSICACHPCAGAMLIFSVSFKF